MATPILFILPGTNNQFSFPSPVYPRRAATASIGEDLFNYLYPYPICNKEPVIAPVLPNHPPAYYLGLEKNESNYEEIVVDNVRKVLPKSGVTGPLGARVEDPLYTARVDGYKSAGLFDNSIIVYQRPWAATHALSQRPLLSTNGIALCIFIIIYDPVSRVAAAAHIDKDQDSSTIIDLLPRVFPGNARLELTFVGGQHHSADMELGTRKNLFGQLEGFMGYLQVVNRPILIKRFDVLGRTHSSDLTFDSRNGQMVTLTPGNPPGVAGAPLDTLFRYWAPTGQYQPDWDGSRLCLEAERLRPDPVVNDYPKKALVDYLATIRCQWDGSPTGWAAFYQKSNDIICTLTVSYIVQLVPDAFANTVATTTALADTLKAKNTPMMFEQSLKVWAVWAALTEDQQKEIGKAVEPSPQWKQKTRAETTLVFLAGKRLKKLKKATTAETLAEFNDFLNAWSAKGDFAVAWEGRH